MIAGTVYNLVVDSLKGNGKLSDYIEQVYKGLRNNIEPESMPCICVEPAQNNELVLDMNKYKNVNLSLDIIAYAYSPSDTDLAIVGDKNYKGILDIENDIRACLQASNTLGDNVLDIQFEPTLFDYSAYPNRGMVIPITIQYRQEDGV